MKLKKLNTDQLIEELRKLVARCNAPERDLYTALCNEADNWQQRLEELDAEED